MGFLSGLMDGGSSKAAQAMADATKLSERQKRAFYEQAANELRTAGATAATGYGNLANTAKGMYEFSPVTARNAFGSTGYDPTTGQVTSSLSPEYAGYKGMFGQGLDAVSGQLAGMGYDPTQISQNWMQRQQGLLQPGRTAELDAVARKMKALGVTGVTSNVATQGGGVAGINPHMAALTNSWANQDAQLAANAEQYGQNMFDTMLNRQRGMFGNVMGVDDLASKANAMAMGWQGQAAPFQLGGNQAYLSNMGQSIQMPYNTAAGLFGGAQGFVNNIGQGALAQGQADAAKAMSKGSMLSGLAGFGMNLLTGGLGGGLFGGLGGSLGGVFSGLPTFGGLNGVGGGTPSGWGGYSF